MGTVGGVRAPAGMTLVVVDFEQRPLLVAAAAEELAAANGAGDALRHRCAGIGYGLLISPSSIRLFNGTGDEPLASWSTLEVLGSYHPGFAQMQSTPLAMMTLVEAWLSDLAYGWSGRPIPGGDTFERIGLATKLRSSVPAHVHPDERGSLRP